MSDHYNQQIAQLIVSLCQNQSVEAIKILEVGAGTGGSSLAILTALKEHNIKVEYCYTDVSMAFVEYGVATD